MLTNHIYLYLYGFGFAILVVILSFLDMSFRQKARDIYGVGGIFNRILFWSYSGWSMDLKKLHAKYFTAASCLMLPTYYFYKKFEEIAFGGLRGGDNSLELALFGVLIFLSLRILLALYTNITLWPGED